jgi:hypothetical protein
VSTSRFDRFEEGKKTLEKNSMFRTFERWSSPHTHPGGSVMRLIIQKMRVVIIFLIRRLASGSGREGALSTLKSLERSAVGKEVLVIASGPSAARVNTRAVAKAQREGTLVVIATNYFLSSSLATTITPDYLVWSDSVFHPSKAPSNVSWAELESRPSLKVMVPWTWRHKIPAQLKERFLFFDDDTLETWSRNISPVRPRGYQGTTGVKAVSLGIHLGAQRINVIGLDLSYFKNFSVDEHNRVLRNPTHLAGTDSGTQNLSHNTVAGLADALYSTANQFYYLRTLFAGYPIVNLDPDSLVDAFDKLSGHPFAKKSR